MKIVRTNLDTLLQNKREQLANEGCDICPCCGENMPIEDAISQGYGLKKGISSFSIPTYVFLSGVKTVTYYSCNTCGAEWESESY